MIARGLHKKAARPKSACLGGRFGESAFSAAPSVFYWLSLIFLVCSAVKSTRQDKALISGEGA